MNKCTRERSHSWLKELWLSWRQINGTRGCFFNEGLWVGKYRLVEPQTGHDFILKHTAHVFSFCLQFSRPLKWLPLLTAKSKYRKSTISRWVRKKKKTHTDTQEMTTKAPRYWPVILPHGNRESGEPAKEGLNHEYLHASMQCWLPCWCKDAARNASICEQRRFDKTDYKRKEQK